MLYFSNSHLLGLIPDFFDDADPRPAAEQLAERYQHGGGYRPCAGFKLFNAPTHDAARIEWTDIEDPGSRYKEKYREVGRGRLPLTSERLIVFDGSWLAIVQRDNSFVVCRVD